MSTLRIEVVYALPLRQRVIELILPAPCTVEQAIRASGILREFPEIDLACQPLGVFGRRVALTDRLGDGDRVEIYRPLVADPKEARRRRAAVKRG